MRVDAIADLPKMVLICGVDLQASACMPCMQSVTTMTAERFAAMASCL